MMDNWQHTVDEYKINIYEYIPDIAPYISSLVVKHVPKHIIGPQEEHDQYLVVISTAPIVPDIYQWHSNPEQLLWFNEKKNISAFSDEMNDAREAYADGPASLGELLEGQVMGIAKELLQSLEPEFLDSFDYSIEDVNTEDHGLQYIYEAYVDKWY